MQAEWWTKLSLYLVQTHPLLVFPNSFHIPGGAAHELISTLASCLLPRQALREGSKPSALTEVGVWQTEYRKAIEFDGIAGLPVTMVTSQPVSTVSIMPCIHEPVMLTPTCPNSLLEYTPLREGGLWSSRPPEWHTSDTQRIHMEEMEAESTGVMKAWLGNALLYSGVKRVSPSPGLPQTCLVTKATFALPMLLTLPPAAPGGCCCAIYWKLSVKRSINYSGLVLQSGHYFKWCCLTASYPKCSEPISGRLGKATELTMVSRLNAFSH